MTGYGSEEDRRKTADAGFHHHFVKPVDPSELREVLTDIAQADVTTAYDGKK
ncbi:MAG: hypothetical protein QM775_19585 [Pirellulales bacterium]